MKDVRELAGAVIDDVMDDLDTELVRCDTCWLAAQVVVVMVLILMETMMITE